MKWLQCFLVAKWFLSIFFIITLTRCGEAVFTSFADSSVGDMDEEAEYSGEDLEGGAVTKVDIDEEMGSAEIDFDELSGSEEFVLVVYSYNEDKISNSFELESLNEPDGAWLAKEEDEEELLSSDDITEDLHQIIREAESTLHSDFRLQNNSSFLLKSTTEPSLGSKQTFKVLNSLAGIGNYSTVTATLQYKNSDFFIYVDERDEASLSSTDIETIAVSFAPHVGYEQELFGPNSDVDGDGHFSILFTRVVNQMGGSSGGIITGFFYAVDLFSADEYSQSNEREVIFTYVPDPDGELGTPISKNFSLSNIYPSVLPHEYQHMINANRHIFENGGPTEAPWLNEALAHFAEGIPSRNSAGYLEGVGLENASRTAGYLADTDTLCFTCGASLYQRGGSFLFLRYLYEQAEKGKLSGVVNGAELIENLLGTSLTGVENVIMSAYGDGPVDERFRDLMGQFGLALFLSDTGLSNDPRLGIDGMNLRAKQNDNRGTNLKGPALQIVDSLPIAGSIGASSIAYYEISGEEIINAGGVLELDLSGAEGMGAYLIQTGL